MFSPNLVASWIRRLHGSSAGRIHVCSDLSWSGQLFDHQDLDGSVAYITELDARGAKGIYLRATSISNDATIETGKERGGAAISQSLPGLWADIDLAGPGHKHTPNRPDLPGWDPNKRIVHPLPTSERQVHQILMAAGLPCPTHWIHSGGGLYPWWILEEPRDLTTDPMELGSVAALSANWQDLLGSIFEAHGLHYGTGVGDLARVLRIPGTINRKVPEDPRPCRAYQEFGNGPTYSLDVLEEALTDLQAGWTEKASEYSAQWDQRPPQEAPRAMFSTQPAREYRIEDDTPLNDYERRMGWDELLGGAGWSLHHTGSDGTLYWTRPGKDRRDGWSATTNNAADRDRMYCFSDAAGLPVNEPMTKGFVYAQFHCLGDMSVAAATLRQRGFGGQVAAPSAPQNPGEWVHQPSGKPQPSMPEQLVTLTPMVDDRRGYGPRFPTQVLPGNWGNYVDGLSRATNTPADLTAMHLLASVASIAGPRLQVQREPGWAEPVTFYGMVAMPTGTRKSVITRRFTKLLVGLSDQITERRTRQMEPRYLELERELASVEEQIKMGKEGGGGDPRLTGALKRRAKSLDARLQAMSRTIYEPARAVLTGNVTAEGLEQEAAQNGGWLNIFDHEGTMLRNLVGQYSPTVSNLDAFLKGYDGEYFTSSRVTRDSLTIDRLALSMILAAQPSIVAGIYKHQLLDDSGWMHRFILCIPEPVQEVLDGPLEPPSWAGGNVDPWQSGMDDLGELLGGIIEHCPLIEGGADAASMLTLSREAWIVHEDSRRRILASKGAMSAQVRSWAHKHEGRLLRLAAILHLLGGHGTDEQISGETMLAADAVAAWAGLHQVRALETLTTTMQVDGRLSVEAQRVAEYLDQADGPVSRSSIRTEVFSRNCAKGMLDQVWEELSLTNRYQRFKKRIGNGRPTEFWGLVESEPEPQPAPTSDSVPQPQAPAADDALIQRVMQGLNVTPDDLAEVAGPPGSGHFAYWSPGGAGRQPQGSASQPGTGFVPEDPSSQGPPS